MIPASIMDVHTILSIVSTGAVAKLVLMAVRTMPPPPGSCGFWCRWFYDFLQAVGDNSDKIGVSRPDSIHNKNTIVTDKTTVNEQISITNQKIPQQESIIK